MSADRCICGALINPVTADQEFVNGQLVFVCADCATVPPVRCVDCGSDGECLPGCPARSL